MIFAPESFYTSGSGTEVGHQLSYINASAQTAANIGAPGRAHAAASMSEVTYVALTHIFNPLSYLGGSQIDREINFKIYFQTYQDFPATSLRFENPVLKA